MKKIFNKLGFRKMDEMEKNIALRAQRIALAYSLFVLVLWSLYESYKVYTYHAKLNIIPCFLLVSTCWVLIIAQSILKRQAIKDDKEYQEENPIWKILLVIFLVAGIVIFIGCFAVMLRMSL